MQLGKAVEGLRLLYRPQNRANPAQIVTKMRNKCWSAEFMSEALSDGRRLGTFSVVDDFHREALAIEVDFSLTAERTVRVLERIAALRGYPLKLRIDNSPQFIDMTLVHWALQHGVTLYRASPLRNAFIERFNSKRPRSRTRQVLVSNLE